MSNYPASPPKPTVVLIHGAFAESASWNGVAGRLLDDGYSVLAVANPLRGAQIDAAYAAIASWPSARARGAPRRSREAPTWSGSRTPTASWT